MESTIMPLKWVSYSVDKIRTETGILWLPVLVPIRKLISPDFPDFGKVPRFWKSTKKANVYGWHSVFPNVISQSSILLPLILLSCCTAGPHQRNSEGRGNKLDHAPRHQSDKTQRQTFTLIFKGRLEFVSLHVFELREETSVNTQWEIWKAKGLSWTQELPTLSDTVVYCKNFNESCLR